MKDLPNIARRARLILVLLAVAGVPFSAQWSAGSASANSVAPRLDDRPAPAAAVAPARESVAGLQLPHRDVSDAPVADLFAGSSWYVPPPPPPPPPPPGPPPPPSAPPLPYIYMGSYVQEGEPTVYFLVKADRVYNVKIGDTLDDIYSIDAVSNGTMAITYKPLNIQQTLAVGGGS